MPRLSNEFQAVLRSYPHSRRLQSVSPMAELVFLRLVVVSDHFGRFFADPAEVLALAFTLRFASGSMTEATVRGALDELSAVDLIRRYEAEGAYCLEIQRYFDPTPKTRKRARFPIPPWAGPAALAPPRPTPPVVDRRT